MRSPESKLHKNRLSIYGAFEDVLINSQFAMRDSL